MEFNIAAYECLIEQLDVKDNSEDCWEWQGCRDKAGYGTITKRRARPKENGSSPKTHRVAYELFFGDIPDGLLVCHTCDNPPCCNPRHLWTGTSKQNTQDAVKKNRMDGINRGETNGSAKLAERDVLDIRDKFFFQQKTIKELAAEYNVSRGLIELVVHGWKKWKHLPLTPEQEALVPILLPRMLGRKSDKERFLMYVDPPYTSEPHWLWKGYINKKGMPKFNLFKDGKASGAIALRAAYEIFIGKVPEGYQVKHTCDILACANPYHAKISKF